MRTGLDKSINSSRQQCLYIDVTRLYQSDAGTGIQRVVRELYAGLREAEMVHKVVPVVASRWFGFRAVDPLFMNVSLKKRSRSSSIKVCRGDIFLGLDLNAHKIRRNRHLLRIWSKRGVFISFLIFDLLPLHKPEWFEPKLVKRFRSWFDIVMRVSDLILCISRVVAEDVRSEMVSRSEDIKHFPSHLDVIQLGLNFRSDDNYRLNWDDSRAVPTALNGNYALMVGTIEPRKGHMDVIDVFDVLWRESDSLTYSLVLVGKRGWKTQNLERRILSHREYGNRLFWLQHVSDEELGIIYKNSKFIIAASFSEGFGLPVVEASFFDKPLIIRDIPVFREVVRGRHVFFDTEGAGLKHALKAAFDNSIAWMSANCGHGVSWREASQALYSLLVDAQASVSCAKRSSRTD